MSCRDRNNSPGILRIPGVSNRDEAISDYVRMRIREWEDSKRELKALAKEAGVAKSSPSGIKKGVGVAYKAGVGYAKAFGFKSYFPPMQLTAYAWWLRVKGAANAVDFVNEPAVVEAIDIVSRVTGASPERLRTIAGDFSAPRFRDRDTIWWVTLLSEEVRREDGATSAAQSSHQRKRATAGATRSTRRRPMDQGQKFGSEQTISAELPSGAQHPLVHCAFAVHLARLRRPGCGSSRRRTASRYQRQSSPMVVHVAPAERHAGAQYFGSEQTAAVPPARTAPGTRSCTGRCSGMWPRNAPASGWSRPPRTSTRCSRRPHS